MNQWTRTGIFAGAAVLCVLLAWASRPRPVGDTGADPVVGKVLFDDLKDPEKVRSLEILYVDPDVSARGSGSSQPSDVSTFKVARIDGRWVIPSHQNYPADAEDQMRDAATALIGVEAIKVASDMPSEHKMFGVVEPDPEKTSASDEGVGKLIIMKDTKNKDLARLIIGEKVKGQEDRHFVRKPGQDRVYTAKIDENVFSTKFEKWIEKDLLKLNTSDIRKVVIRDHTVQTGIDLQGQLQPASFQQRLDMTLDWDQDDNEWKLGELIEFPNRRPTRTTLLDTEELNTSKLNDMKWALDDLDIVDVERKPKGLRRDLSASEDFLKDAGARNALAVKGYFPVMRDDKLDLISTDGEILIRTADAVEYVLRFGESAGMSGDDDEGKLNRYLFVTARLDDEGLQPPELEQVPEGSAASRPSWLDTLRLPSLGDASSEKRGGTIGAIQRAVLRGAAEDKADDAQDPEAPGDDGPGAPQGEAGTEGEPGAETSETVGDAAAEADATDAGNSEPAAATDATADETASEFGDVASDPAAEPPADPADTQPAGGDASDEASVDRQIDLAAERERIVRENTRKMDEWEEKKKKARKTVAELNARFGDWYFVISDDVYEKIHLSRSDVIKEKDSAKEEGSGVDSFRDLEEGGVEGGGDDHDGHDH